MRVDWKWRDLPAALWWLVAYPYINELLKKRRKR